MIVKVVQQTRFSVMLGLVMQQDPNRVSQDDWKKPRADKVYFLVLQFGQQFRSFTAFSTAWSAVHAELDCTWVAICALQYVIQLRRYCRDLEITIV